MPILPPAPGLPRTSKSAIAERKISRRSTGRPLPGISVSIGVAQYRTGEAMNDLIDAATARSISPRTVGRNRVVTEPVVDRATAAG